MHLSGTKLGAKKQNINSKGKAICRFGQIQPGAEREEKNKNKIIKKKKKKKIEIEIQMETKQ